MVPDTALIWTVTWVSFILCIQTSVYAGDAEVLERAYQQMRDDMRQGRCTPMLDAFIHCRQRNDYIGADVNRVDDGTGDFPKGGPQAPSGPGPVDSGPIVESPAGVMVDKKQAGHEVDADKRKDWEGLKSYLKLMGYGRRK